jgi:ketosteroid isomerase-like protein
MGALTNGSGAVVLLALASCAGSRDIVHDPFPDAQAAVRREIESLADAVRRKDADAVRSAHLESPKFTKFGRDPGRLDFEQMVASESAGLSALQDPVIEHRDLKIDVFGPAAVVTSFLLASWTDENGERAERELRATAVWVETPLGWKLAHEHNTPTDD